MRDRELADVQRLFAEAVRAPRPLDRLDQGAASALVLPSARGMTPAERLEVYRDQYWLRHRSNLNDDFPTLAWAAGEASMPALLDEYLEAHPPGSWDLQRLGARMPAFVAGHPRWSALPHAVDAARLDWAFMEIFDAPDSPPLDPDDIAGVAEDAWPRALIVLQSALRLLVLEAPLHDVREALKRGAPTPVPGRAVIPLAVWRDPQCFLRAMAIEPAAHALLSAVGRGQALGEACAAVAASADAPDVEGSVGRWFQEWTERAWISGVRATATSTSAGGS